MLILWCCFVIEQLVKQTNIRIRKNQTQVKAVDTQVQLFDAMVHTIY